MSFHLKWLKTLKKPWKYIMSNDRCNIVFWYFLMCKVLFKNEITHIFSSQENRVHAIE